MTSFSETIIDDIASKILEIENEWHGLKRLIDLNENEWKELALAVAHEYIASRRLTIFRTVVLNSEYINSAISKLFGKSYLENNEFKSLEAMSRNNVESKQFNLSAKSESTMQIIADLFSNKSRVRGSIQKTVDYVRENRYREEGLDYSKLIDVISRISVGKRSDAHPKQRRVLNKGNKYTAMYVVHAGDKNAKFCVIFTPAGSLNFDVHMKGTLVYFRSSVFHREYRFCILRNIMDFVCNESGTVDERANKIKKHSDGGIIELKLHVKMLARSYVLFALIISFCAGYFDWYDRGNTAERIMDGVQVATTMCVSVFGLIKLTSEDDNAIRNTLLGVRILRKPQQLAFYLGLSSESQLKAFLSRRPDLKFLLNSHMNSVNLYHSDGPVVSNCEN